MGYQLQRKPGGSTLVSSSGTFSHAPGKRTLTEQLHVQMQRRASTAPAHSTVEEAAARGVSEPGGTLPFADQIQRAFGPHDISGIRAHTGPAATEASSAMGAEAFATGNDVAFGSTPTLHTAAHEAAHVVQQRHGVQLKGGVGEEGDIYERHADEVADRVVAGQSVAELLCPFSASAPTTSTNVQHKKRRKPPTYNAPPMELKASDPMPNEQYAQAAASSEHEQADEDATEQAHANDLKDDAKPPDILRVGNHSDIFAATRLMEQIEGYRPRLVKGIRDGMIHDSALASNIRAVGVLGDFIAAAGEQGRALSNFQSQVLALRRDSARFVGQLKELAKTNPGVLKDMAVIDALGGTQPLNRAAKNVGATGEAAAHWTNLQTQHTNMHAEVDDATSAQQDAISARNGVMRALSAIEGGITQRQAPTVDGADVLETTSNIKKVLSFGVDKLFEHFKIPGSGIADAATGWLVDQWFAPQLRELSAKTQEAGARQEHGAEREQQQDLLEAIHHWAAQTGRVYAAMRAVQQSKNNERVGAQMFAVAAEQHEQPDVGTAAQMFAEADALAAQYDLVIGLGQAEVSAAADATSAGTLISKTADGTQMMYYAPIETYANQAESWLPFDTRTVGVTYEAETRKIVFNTDSDGHFGGSEGVRGVNPTVAMALVDLQATRPAVVSVRDQLQLALNLGKDAPPQ